MTTFDQKVDAIVKICTVLMPLLIIVVPIILNRRQSKDLKAHSDQNMAKINAATAEVTGQHKTLTEG